MRFADIFARTPVIGCVHLMPLPGSPRYDGSMQRVTDHALAEAQRLVQGGVDGLIVENFRDAPFYPDRVPAETVASLCAVARDLARMAGVPLGINVLRNDGMAALAIAAAVSAQFVRINVLGGAVVSEQGLIVGRAHDVLRLRASLLAPTLIFADVGVKHAAPLAPRGLAVEAIDATHRNLADALIVSGERTGQATDPADLQTVKAHTSLPVLVGSGATADSLPHLWPHADGYIVGSALKKDGVAMNDVDPARLSLFMDRARSLRGS